MTQAIIGCRDITSIGKASALLNTMPGKIESAAVALGVVPAVRINGVPHYGDDDLERIREHLKGSK